MADFRLMSELRQSAPGKIVLLVLDGLGGMPMEPGGPTELEAAHTPNMDQMAIEGTLGQTIPIRHGISPGSGPSHLALFGYDPIGYSVGRGVLEAIGVGMEVHKGDVAARGNFCTLNAFGKITDRRAGRISTDAAAPLVEKIGRLRLTGVELDVRQVREYRFAVVMRGRGLEAEIDDTDPQQVGVEPLPAKARSPGSQRAADLFNAWIAEARKLIADQPKANSITLRGFSTDPGLPQFPEIYGLRAACVAVYPMYRGVSQLVGMDILEFEGDRPEDEFAAVANSWDQYDFFFVHIKKTDSMGEDGNFDGKVKVIEGVDAALPALLALEPAAVAITGDHSTPAHLRTHTWHPVPFLLWAPGTCLPDDQSRFGERACQAGGLGTIPATEAMPLLMAHAGRLTKYGA